MLSRFNSNPGPKHWEGVKHVLRYLKGTVNYCLFYKKTKDDRITGYSDADWNSSDDNRKSITGFLFTAAGGAISWASKKQLATSLSTCEAEYYSLSSAVQEALCWKGLRSQIVANEAITIYCDNHSTIAIAQSKGYNPKTKHIDIRYNFVKDATECEDVKLAYIDIKLQPADALTKSLDKTKIIAFREMMGIKSIGLA